MSKIYAFDYMLSLFENWYNEENKEQNKGFSYCIYNHRTTKTNQKYPSVNL